MISDRRLANAAKPERRYPSAPPLRERGGNLPISTGALSPAALLNLQRTAGNRAVLSLLEGNKPRVNVQREIGWKDASKQGRGWNTGAKMVGKIRRIPLEGLTEGLQQETAKHWVKDKGGGGHWEDESTSIAGLSSESAKGKAIVLVPESLDATAPIEVLIHLHGYTENVGRPFAGYRELTPAAEKTKDPTLAALRQGIPDDAKEGPDTAPVRDVALDRAEQQLEESGYRQQIIVLPQGGLHSQFGKAGDTNFDSDAYVQKIVARLVDETVFKKAPEVARVSMAGHSGAGATLANMARESVRRHAGKDPGKSSTLTGDLVLLDAINSSGELSAFIAWARMRLDDDLAALSSMKTDGEKLAYLRTAQKLRGYHSTGKGYTSAYGELEGAINQWFKQRAHKKALGAFAPLLHANFTIVGVPVVHEELMRGVPAGEVRAGSGTILDALRALHPAGMKSLPAGAPAEKTKPDEKAKPPEKGNVEARQAKPTRRRASAHQARAPQSRAEQIATAILLAKTGGVGQGDTKEERQKGKEAAERSVAHDIEKGTGKQGVAMDVDTWFQSFEPEATFLGLPIRPSSGGEPPGVHHELAVVLKAAEDSLVNAGEKPVEAAARLGVKDIAGLRVPKTPTGKTSGASMHCFGLAVDIDHDNNPFIGNSDKPTKKRPEGGASIQIIAHATLLLGSAALNPLQAPPELKGGHATDSAADREARAQRADEEWKVLNAGSIYVQQYLSMSADDLDKVVKDRLPALTEWQKAQLAEPPQKGKGKKKKKATHLPWVEHVADPSWWHDQHARDLKQSGSGDFGRGSTSDAKKFGFMTLHEEVVKALVTAGLSWGGTYNGDKDVMHFDLRTGSIGGRPVV